MSAHRAALDHVLTLVAESPFAEWLVLRGSMTMPAWVGDAARPPGDLDWMARPPALTPLDDLHPYPYLDRLAPVQQWPEAVHGAARNEIWEFEEFDTGGRPAHLPPEGLNWIPAAGLDSFDEELWDYEFTNLLSRNPRTLDGIQFDTESIDMRQDWDYADYEPGGENGRLRLELPWQSPTGEEGTVQVDLSFGEPMPDAPVCTAVPRAGGLPPLGLWTASAQLSLAWKLHWLAADQQTHGVSAMKDVYDAVLLAELDGMCLRPRLRRLALGADHSLLQSPSAPPHQQPSPRSPAPARQPGSLDPALAPRFAAPALPFTRLLEPSEIRRWRVSGTLPGVDDPASWLSRLAVAVTGLL
ncbi:hypothetical protein Ait01nite_066070 [Actinoplanes italicus]|uniref:Nucleotidyltransferase AbiEii toxin of type IV toxin-antitoxin system n=1 Tax=Actinoplanes italicus TaxID=113567 RepID=A0A2T0KQF6_9ACTN|nr:nucleotidyl transferase AbiEii/AbiGii toxin family protein [Actinoplanes italicus]PRX25978.1 nucleotidyltransferase AbiEii toxin of type IV toxin-antitoxin system [Actinoplanes italicus]GIE33562.1 hypothetical protein Ait01nite_066070 [Actinoplanes italicus]